jgi:uncharacterized protein (TIRG00374 family)
MKRFFLFLASLAIGAAIFFWVAESVGWAGIAESISIFTRWQGWIVFLITFLVFLLSVWRWREIIKSLSPGSSLKGITGSYFAGYALMYLAPILVLGGEAFRVYALKEKNGVSQARGAASVFIDRFLEWTFNIVIIIFGMVFFFSSYQFDLVPKKIRLVFGLIFLASALAIAVFYIKIFRKESAIGGFLSVFGFKKSAGGNFLEVEKEVFSFFRAGNVLMWKAMAISFFRAILLVVRTWVLVLFLGENVAFSGALTILSFSHLAAMLPIPAALGTHEVLQILAFNSLGIGSSSAISFAMIIRSCEVIFSLVGVITLFKLSYDLLKESIFGKIDNFKR